MGSVLFPDEADPVLIVDPDAVLSGPPAFQRFQPVPRRDAKIEESTGSFHLIQLAERYGGDCRPTPVCTSFEELLSNGISKALDHLSIV